MNWLVFVDKAGLGAQLVAQLRGAQHEVTEVVIGPSFRQTNKSKYEINPERAADYHSLLQQIQKRRTVPTKIVYLWSIDTSAGRDSGRKRMQLDFTEWTRRWKTASNAPTDITVVHNSAMAMDRDEGYVPACTSMREALERLANDFPGATCRCINVETQAASRAALQVIHEISSASSDSWVSYRGAQRFVALRACTDSAGRRNGSHAGLEPHGLAKVECALQRLWTEILEVDEVEPDDDFFDLGGHSLIGVQLLSEVKRRYGVDLGLSVLFESRTVRQLAERIIRESQTDRSSPELWSPLVPIQPKGNRDPLFAISGLGGNVIKFHPLAVHLGEKQPIYGLLPRGMDGQAPFHTRIEDIAADYVRAIRSLQPEGPYRLVGYSFGGIVAFETAQQLTAGGALVEHLGLFDTFEWEYFSKLNSAPSIRTELKKVYRYFQGVFEHRRRSADRMISTTEGPMGLLEATEQANRVAARNYKPKPYPGRATLYRSTTRTGPEVTDPLLGWGRLLTGGIEVHEIAADHFSILKEPAVSEVAERLLGHLSKAE